MEQTFLMVKPDGVERGLIGEIIGRIERKGFIIREMKMMNVTEELAKAHYEEHAEKPFFGELVTFLTSGPVVALRVEGTDVVAVSRLMIGKTKPLEASPGTIRGDFANTMSENVIHGSDSVESAERELALWFQGQPVMLAGLLIYVNWQVFLIGALSDRVIETSLGYFINPIFTVLLGVLVLRERITRLQTAAIGIAAIAVVVIVVAYGDFPWIAVGLTLTFGLYGLVKKRIGSAVDAVSGLTLESFWLIPVAVVSLVVVGQTAGLTLGTVSPVHTLLVAFVGVATAVPLLLFAAGTRRIDLSLVGLLQFIAPVMQFLVGWAVLGEPMPLERWAGFVLVWIAIVVFVVDLLLQRRRGRRQRPAPLV